MSAIAMSTTGFQGWRTPPKLFRELEKLAGGFDLDACASDHNRLCERYFTEQVDCRKHDWNINDPLATIVFMNPPYGKGVASFIRKAYEQSFRNCSVYCLLKISADTEWWHKYVMQADEIWFIRRRVIFHDEKGQPSKNSPPFPSAIVVFKPKETVFDISPKCRSWDPDKGTLKPYPGGLFL